MRKLFILLIAALIFSSAQRSSATLTLDVGDVSVVGSTVTTTNFSLPVTLSVSGDNDPIHVTGFTLNLGTSIPSNTVKLISVTIPPTDGNEGWSAFSNPSTNGFVTNALNISAFNFDDARTINSGDSLALVTFNLELAAASPQTVFALSVNSVDIFDNNFGEYTLDNTFGGSISTPEPASMGLVFGIAACSLARRRARRARVMAS